jgi:hypothetical protein
MIYLGLLFIIVTVSKSELNEKFRIQAYINKNVIHSMKLTLKQWIMIASAVIGAVIVSSFITSLILRLE